jgi:hypothetical protein
MDSVNLVYYPCLPSTKSLPSKDKPFKLTLPKSKVLSY